ncbi:dolichyl-phosphate beta-glucosyltransferase [Streptosporangium sp. CA-135522]|uniref:dolichyl-phosphate beta-glucosyltransferase n=1 Tax=Streptosporangium sp. CA-135522 TaxID=3240072 RepID=UPI003D8D3FBE
MHAPAPALRVVPRRHRNRRTVPAAPAMSAISSVSVDIVIPVFNEERALPGCIAVLHDYLGLWFPFQWTITIVDNASTDGTRVVARAIARRRSHVRVLCLDRKGKGHALRTAWSDSRADIVAYMDVDLSTGLDALLPLVTSLASGHSDIAIGSRLAPGARNVRGAKRELISRGYNALLRLTHGVRFRDAQCGFKAARTSVIRPLLRHVKDDSWFFDTELLLLAEHNGLRVHEVPVDWVEDVDSRVGLAGTAAVNLRGLLRIALAKATGGARVAGLPSRPMPRPTHPDAVLAARSRAGLRRALAFGVAGALPAAGALGVYALLRTWCPPPAAGLAAAGLITRLNTRAGWLSAFTGEGGSPAPEHLPGPLVFGLYSVPAVGALSLLRAAVHRPARPLELATLLVASAAGTAGHLALRQAARPAAPAPATPIRFPGRRGGDV